MKQLTLLAALILGGCAGSTVSAPEACPIEQVDMARANGVVDFIWEEPMTNVIDVPPGLDPEGQYYRPAHRQVVEIRQGRWRAFEPR